MSKQRKGSGNGGGYGSRIGAPKGTNFSSDFVDSDNDGVDDRNQRGPGRPDATGGNTRRRRTGTPVNRSGAGAGSAVWGGSPAPIDDRVGSPEEQRARNQAAAPNKQNNRRNGGGGNGGGGNNNNGNNNNGGGNGNGNGGGRNGMSFREFIQYQNKQARSAARSDAQETRQGVYDWVHTTFDQWGMPGGFADNVINIVQDARSPEQAMTMIRDTAEYKERFAGNIARTKAGYGMLSEAEYLGLERSYRQSLRANGLPEGFYDDPKDMADWIAKDVSPEELAARSEMAGSLALQKDPQLWRELRARGITKGDAAAYMLDPDRALPAIQKKLSSAEIGRQAREAGLNFNTKFENKLVDKGISAEAAGAAFDKVAEEENNLDALAAQYGQKEFTAKGLAKAELGVGGKKVKARKRGLASRERSQWGGQSGSASGAFGGGSF